MKQAFQPGFYWDPDLHQEVEVRAGVVRPDGHADVVRCPAIFRDVVVEEPPAPPAAPAAKSPVRAAARTAARPRRTPGGAG